jgi:hypothetical protein
MKTKWLVPALVATVVLFLWTIREPFEDTASVHGPPYGNTATEARKLIDIMPPSMLVSIKKKMGVTSATLSDADAVKIVYGSGTNNSPIAQTMSSFYWQVYKPATSTISVAQVNNFIGLQTDSWIVANIPDMRDFLTRYFVQGQNGAAQSGYGDLMNTVWGSMRTTTPAAATTDTEKTTTTTTTPSTDTFSTLAYVGIFITALSVLAVFVTLMLPARNVL